MKETRTGKKIKKLLSFKLSSFFILRRRSRIGRATDAELYLKILDLSNRIFWAEDPFNERDSVNHQRLKAFKMFIAQI